MHKLIIIDSIWSPYSHARYTEITRSSKMDVTIFYQTKTDKFRQWEQNDQDSSYKMHFLKNLSIPLSVNTALSLNINHDVYKQLKLLNPDRIILIGWDSFATLVSVVYAKLNKKELILWAGSTQYEKSLIRTLTTPYVRLLIKMFDGFISYGTAAANYLRSLGAKKTIHHFYNSVDVDSFTENAKISQEQKTNLLQRNNLKEDSLKIIYCGRLVEIKQVDMLINTFLELEQEHSNIELIIVGYGPEEEKLKKLAGDQSTIHFTGSLKPTELAKFYSLSDIFVLPSQSEPWGLVTNEAMACGCAVVVSHHCGCSVDLVKDNGFVFDANKTSELKERLNTIISSPELLDKMKQESLKDIQNYKPKDLVKTIPYFIEETNNA